MHSNRADILDWADQGRIAPDKLRPALELAGALPDAARWRRLIERTLLFIGVAALAAGVMFFFAFNWRWHRNALLPGMVLRWSVPAIMASPDLSASMAASPSRRAHSDCATGFGRGR